MTIVKQVALVFEKSATLETAFKMNELLVILYDERVNLDVDVP